LKLLDLVLGEKVISGSLLKNNINDIPLKYLLIKKFKIDKNIINKLKNEYKNDIFVKYLSLLLYDHKNKEIDLIFETYFDFNIINWGEFIEEYWRETKIVEIYLKLISKTILKKMK
jgi:Tfp pilus assembly pilus retraction ATPase PilT